MTSRTDSRFTRSRRPLLGPLTTLCLLVALGATLAAAKIQVQRDPKFDFAKLKTWEWNPGGPGNIKVIIRAESKSEPVQRQYEPAILKAIEDQFAARGYTRAKNGRPDFLVTYYMLITMGSTAQYMGQFLPQNYQFGIPMFPAATQSLEIYPEGAMVVDAATPAVTDVVWRGMAEAKIEIEHTEEKRIARINSVVKDLLGKFPKAKK